MLGFMKIGRKILSIQDAVDRLNYMGFEASDFSDSMHILSLEFPFIAAITIINSCKASIRSSSQNIAKAEAI